MEENNTYRKETQGMGKIASNTTIANTAVADVKAISVNKGEQVSLAKSTISSMQTGKKVNNQLLPNLAELVDCVQAESEKFPKIAEMMALQDSQIKF
ncbi:hypothetical protein [Listeria goaensis]|uniref:hypothetical protein n=2 Tax=Listeriaceae TaxID=186820 RepID=UPI001F07959B|nr:hypothetical protein [Listeria goaensis]